MAFSEVGVWSARTAYADFREGEGIFRVDPVRTFRKGAANLTHRNQRLLHQPVILCSGTERRRCALLIMANPLKLVSAQPRAPPGWSPRRPMRRSARGRDPDRGGRRVVAQARSRGLDRPARARPRSPAAAPSASSACTISPSRMRSRPISGPSSNNMARLCSSSRGRPR